MRKLINFRSKADEKQVIAVVIFAGTWTDGNIS